MLNPFINKTRNVDVMFPSRLDLSFSVDRAHYYRKLYAAKEYLAKTTTKSNVVRFPVCGIEVVEHDLPE